MSKEGSDQEKIYQSLNKTVTDVLRVIKFLIWPITIIFLFVAIFWGVDIIKLHSELENIKNGLDISKKEIEVSEREANLKARESLADLTNRLAKIDSTFKYYELEYIKALEESKTQRDKLQKDSNSLDEFSTMIQEDIKDAMTEYESIQQKYADEIEYAAKGAKQRKEDMDKLYRENRQLLMELTLILNDFIKYIKEKAEQSLELPEYNAKKVGELNQKLKTRIKTFQQELEKEQ